VLWSDRSKLSKGGRMATHTPTIAEQAQTYAVESTASMPGDMSSAFAAERAALQAHGVAAPGSAKPRPRTARCEL
jgi:hypothetical protein